MSHRKVGTWKNPIKGVLADTIKATLGYGVAEWAKPPVKVGKDKRGLRVLYFYDGAIVELRVFKWKKDVSGPQSAYRVHSVIGPKRKEFVAGMAGQL